MSTIDPRQDAARRAAEEAQRRAAEAARRRAAERAREEARARELAERLSSALESRQQPASKEVARVLKEAETLGPEARARFLEEAGTRPGRTSGETGLAEAAEALRARIAEAYPEASDGRRQLGEALLGVRGEDPRGMAREAFERVVSETISRLGAAAATARPTRAAAATADHLERAPDVSRFGGGARPAGAVAGGVRPQAWADSRGWRGESPRSAGVRPSPARARAAPSPPVARTVHSPPPPAGRAVHEGSSGAQAARAADVALDRDDLAAALGQPRVSERAASTVSSRADIPETPRAEAARHEPADATTENIFERLRHSIVLTPGLAEAAVAPGLHAVSGSIESAARSLARAREAISDGSHENVRVQYGLSQARGFFERIEANLRRTHDLVSRHITPERVGSVRAAATAARAELHQAQLDATEARRELGEISDWTREVGVRSVLRDVAAVSHASRRAEGDLRVLGGRAAVVASLNTESAATAGEVQQSEGMIGPPRNAIGDGTATPELGEATAAGVIPPDFTFGDEDLARIGTGLDPSKPPPQNYWSEELVNTLSDQGRQRGGITDAEGHAHFQLAGQLLEGAEGQKIELGPAEIALALKAAGIPLEKVDPNQLHAAARYVNTATDAADQQMKLRKTLDNFQVLTTIGAPTLTRHQMSEQLWAIARVPGHALENLSDVELQGKYQEILSAINAGPGQTELKVGKHNLKFTVGENGQVTQSETKKPGFFSQLGSFLKKAAPIALMVASFIPFTAPFARIAQGVIAIVKAVRSRSLLGAATAAAGIVAGGAAAFAGRLASGAASTAATVARVANGVSRGLQGVSSIRQGSVLGGIAALGSGFADAIGQVAEGTATGLQRFANGLGDASDRLSYAARGIGVVQGYRSASRAVNEARVALRQAEASGDPAAIGAARQQLEAAEKAKTSALLGGAASAAGLAADVRADYAHFPGAARESPIPQGGLDQALRGASRGLSVAQGVQSGDFASAGVNALGLAAVGRAALGGESAERIGLTDASNLADAGLAYYQTNSANAAADQAVAEAEGALDAARRSGDALAIQQAETNLDQARKAREGALMGAIGAGDSLVLTATQIGEKFDTIREAQRIEPAAAERRAAFDKETERALLTWKEADEQEQAWLAQLRDESLSPKEREAAGAGILALRQAKEAYTAALEEATGDPEAIHAATRAFQELHGRIETQVVNRAESPGYATLRRSTPETTITSRFGVVTVERGMTVWEIAQLTGVSVERILEYNAERGNVIVPTELRVGQKFLVPLDPGDIQNEPKTPEEIAAMVRATIEARRAAATQVPQVHSAEVPFTGESEVDIRAIALGGLVNDRAFITQDEDDSSFQWLSPATWIDNDIDDAKNQALDVFRDAVDRLEALVRDPSSTAAQIHAALNDKNRAQRAFNDARTVVLHAVHETDFLTPVKEAAQEVQDAVHGVTGPVADRIAESGAPAPVVAVATLPLHIVDSIVALDAGIVKGTTDLVQGVAGVVAHPVETAQGAFTLFDQAAQTTLASQAVQFLGEAALGRFSSLEEAVQVWNEQSDPLRLAQAKWDFTTDVGKAMLSESIEAWSQGNYSEAVGIFLGQSADVVVGAGILRSGRLGTAARALDGASDAQRTLGAVGQTGRVAASTADAARAIDATVDSARTVVRTSVGRTSERLVTDTRGFPGPLSHLEGRVPQAHKWVRKGGKVSYHPDGSVTYVSKDGISVTYSPRGYPDFRPHVYNGPEGLSEVRIRLSGDRLADEAAANAAAGFRQSPRNYTWHHHEDLGLMQLVRTRVHRQFWHDGGFSLARKGSS